MWREINADLHVVKKGIELPRSKLLVSPASRNGEPVYVVWDPGDPDKVVAEFCEEPTHHNGGSIYLTWDPSDPDTMAVKFYDEPAKEFGNEEVIREARERLEPIKWRRLVGTNNSRWWITCPSHASRKARGIRVAPCITDWGAVGYCCYTSQGTVYYRLFYRHDRGWKRGFQRNVSITSLMEAARELEKEWNLKHEELGHVA